MSILLSVAVLVGVSDARILGYHGDAGVGGPIELPEARRICATLCMSGLGGRPCGTDCQSIEPPELPVQSDNKSDYSEVSTARTRRSACPLLCYYQLGDPLCSCQPQQRGFDSIFFEVNFDHICRWFCTDHGYHIYGCPTCDSYEAGEDEADAIFKISNKNKDIDWDEWCKKKCREGDGGVACNCDILPIYSVQKQ